MMEKVPMTAGGYAALEVELKKRQSEDRPRIIEHIAEARSHGDLSENAEYHAAKEEQSHNEGRIAELKDLESRVNSAVQQRDENDASRFKNIVIMYENMKAKDAAKIFDRLDLKILVEVATLINPRRMSDILAQMQPDMAQQLTVELAAINATMAGVEPEAFPLVVAALEALLDPSWNAFGITATTSPVFPMLVVNGPTRERLAIDFGSG